MNPKVKLSIGIIAILTLLLILTPFADPNPDGLEKAVGEYSSGGAVFDIGFLTDYGAEGSFIHQIVGDESLSVIISGLIGVILVIGLLSIPLIVVHQRRTSTSS